VFHFIRSLSVFLKIYNKDFNHFKTGSQDINHCKKQDVPYTSLFCIKNSRYLKKVVALFIAVMYNSINLLT